MKSTVFLVFITSFLSGDFLAGVFALPVGADYSGQIEQRRAEGTASVPNGPVGDPPANDDDDVVIYVWRVAADGELHNGD
ncbi:hypothetical protein HJFPF1_05579 [Paramyrothecium foliicola]|nr:hypothetical protein HJFPF1_05579 [Paramyrothecium foliicola]